MHTLLTSTKTETFKIFSNKKFVVLFFISVFISLFASSVNLISTRKLGGPLINNATIPAFVLNFMSSLFLPLFTIMLTSDLFSGEISDKSIIMSLVRPITRNKLYVSKILAIGTSLFVLLLGTFVITEITSFIGGNISYCLEKLPFYIMAYVSAVVPIILLAIITAFFSQFTRSGSLTVIIMICTSVLISALTIIFPEVTPFMPTTYLSWHQNFYSSLNFTKIINELLYILAYGIIFMFAGSYLFYQKDI
ncbi:ABC transporter permease [Acetivibrio clariflavus]|uniref:ABC transporter permease n=1 Tax=Acetivibrio clariflavus TaxID=288965 RepID=UPI0031F4B503